MIQREDAFKVTETLKREREIAAYGLINPELVKLNYKNGDEFLVHQPTWRSLGVLGLNGFKEGTVNGDNRISFPAGRGSLSHSIPNIKTFLLYHGLATAAAALLLLPLLHLLRRFLPGLPCSYNHEETLESMDVAAFFCLFLCFSMLIYWAWPAFFLYRKEQQQQQQPLQRFSPLGMHHVSPKGTSQDERDIKGDTNGFTRVLVLINPTSGAERGIKEYKETVGPLLEKKTNCFLLPIVLDEDATEFLFMFLFCFSSLFSHCLLLGGDGTYNTITNLLQRVAAARKGEETANASQETQKETEERDPAATDNGSTTTENILQGSFVKTAIIENEAEKEAETNGDILCSDTKGDSLLKHAPLDAFGDPYGDSYSRQTTAPVTRRNSSNNNTCSCGPYEGEIKSACSAKLYIHLREKNRLIVSPVPLGTSNTWCSEFLFSDGGREAGKRYIEEAEEELQRLAEKKLKLEKETQEKETEEEETAETHERERHTEGEMAEKETQRLLEETETETAAAARAAAAAAAHSPKDSQTHAEEKQKTNGHLEMEGETEVSNKTEEEDWDEREIKEQKGVNERDRALTAAARIVRRHSRETAEKETKNEGRKTAFLFAAAAALALEKRLLHPQAEENKRRQKETEESTLQNLREEILQAEKQLEDLSSFVSKIGPGKDANLIGKGVKKMLYFWCRRMAEGCSTFTSLLKVETGNHTNFCVNNVELGYLATCMVHSEDLRPLGHLRYFLSPLYQIIRMRKQHLCITATLANGKQIQRQGYYILVALDLIQHWTDDVYVTPWAQINANYAWLLLIRAGISRPELLAYGRHLSVLGPECHGTERFPVTKVILELEKEGVFGLDGEVYRHNGRLTMEVLPRAAHIAVSAHDLNKNSRAVIHPKWAQAYLPPENKCNS